MKMSSARGDVWVIEVSLLKPLVSLVCNRSHDTIGIPYESSETYRSQDANLGYADETEMRNNDSYSPLPTPSGTTGAPGSIPQQPQGSSRFSTANLDAESPSATPPQSGLHSLIGDLVDRMRRQ